MTLTGDLLHLPAAHAARRIALALLDEARAAYDRLDDPEDVEALHDFRFAIRRLRSTARAHRRFLEAPLGKKRRRRLRRIQERTSAARDLEVLLEILRPLEGALSEDEQIGLVFFTDWLASLQADGGNEGVDRARADFRRLEPHLRVELATVETSLFGAGPDPTFGRVLGGFIRHHKADWVALLEGIGAASDEEAAHRARIATKRLRYLIEPLRGQVPAAKKIVSHLKGLQDVLGDLHDVHVLLERLQQVLPSVGEAGRLDTLAGLDRIVAFAREREGELFGAFLETWRGESLDAFLALLEAMAVAVESDVGTETERKYLLRALPDFEHLLAGAVDSVEIEQGWLPGERLRERLRRKRNATGDSYRRTMKLGAGLSRVEVEESIDEGLFGALWPLTAGCRVHKRRYRVSDGALVWEIDQFLDRDLVLAEVELVAESIRPALPGWLEPFVLAEVTDDPSYVNLNLAR